MVRWTQKVGRKTRLATTATAAAAAPLVDAVEDAALVIIVVQIGTLDLAFVGPRAENVNLEILPGALAERRLQFQQLIETLGPE